MSRTQPGRIGLSARWLLLLCTMFGLAIMHTIGHAGMRMTMAGDSHASTAAATVSVPMTAGDAAAPCAGDGCGGHGTADGWSVCLAVLGGLALVTLFAFLLTRRPLRVGVRPLGWARAPGDPGHRPPIPVAGLRVASIAELRI